MDYYIQEYQIKEYAQRTAGSKARDDASAIFRQSGMQMIEMPVKKDRENHGIGIILLAMDQIPLTAAWAKAVSVLKKGDRLFVQVPLIDHSLLIGKIFKKLRKRGVTICLLVHDLESFRIEHRKDMNTFMRAGFLIEERAVLKYAKKIILHNSHMVKAAAAMGIPEKKLISLQIFDYLIPEYDAGRMKKRSISKNEPVIIAGALRKHKAGYAYDLPENCCFNLYGVGYEDSKRPNVNYMGSFPADELPYDLNGSFGLVWDGESAHTCSGLYGNYLRINNPHKTSLYLASGIPVAIWSQAAMADFIQKNRCGIAIDSLEELSDNIRSLSDTDYEIMRQNAEKIGKQVREGHYLLEAIEKTSLKTKK